MTPVQAALLNLEAGRSASRSLPAQIRAARVTTVKDGNLFARGGDGGLYELAALTNGAVAEGQVILIQLQGDRAYFHSMPAG